VTALQVTSYSCYKLRKVAITLLDVAVAYSLLCAVMTNMRFSLVSYAEMINERTGFSHSAKAAQAEIALNLRNASEFSNSTLSNSIVRNTVRDQRL